MRYMDYISTWIAQKGFKGVHKIISTADELDILKHYGEGVDWQDVTDFPDLPAQLAPAYDDSASYILPAENMFKKARVYAPKVKSGPNLTENQALLQAMPAGIPLVLQSRTNFSRWKKLKYIYITFWTNAARTVKATYTGNPGQACIVVSRVEFNPALPPPQAPIVNANPYPINAPNEINRTIIWQVDLGHIPPLNPNSVPFDDLVLLWDDMVDIPYYSEIELWMLGQAGGGFIDVFLGMEVK